MTTLLHLRKEDGSRQSLRWNAEKCHLDNANGTSLLLPQPLRLRAMEDARRMHGHHRRGMRLMLGRHCNYRCQYCCQDHADVAHSGPATPEQITRLLTALAEMRKTDPSLKHFEFWGGEPLAYFPQLKALADGLLQQDKETSFSVVSNGSLITDEMAAYFVTHPFTVGISHDGPGQHLRSGDPLSDAATQPVLERLHRAMGPRMTFNPVFAAGNAGQKAVADYFTQRFGDVVTLSEGSPCLPTDTASLAWTMQGDELVGYSQRFFRDLFSPTMRRFMIYEMDISCLIRAVVSSEPTPGSGGCGAFQKAPFVMNMDGSVVTCLNFDRDYKLQSGSPNGRGNVFEPGPLVRTDVLGWKQRDHCHSCPVLPLCRGGCPMVEGEMHARQCAVKFHHYMALFGYALFVMTGGILESVEGDFAHAHSLGLRTL